MGGIASALSIEIPDDSVMGFDVASTEVIEQYANFFIDHNRDYPSSLDELNANLRKLSRDWTTEPDYAEVVRGLVEICNRGEAPFGIAGVCDEPYILKSKGDPNDTFGFEAGPYYENENRVRASLVLPKKSGRRSKRKSKRKSFRTKRRSRGRRSKRRRSGR